ncbi:MAG: hypothetical protein GX079_02280 [Tissierellia bacterium]|nr:hypothetical protein [Tissierellia bacterium]
MKKLQINCTQTTQGRVKQLKSKGQDFPTIITVEYEVDSTFYEIRESIKLKSQPIRKGSITIGQKKVAIMGSSSVGSLVKVNYNPDNPSEAYLADNIGKVNV